MAGNAAISNSALQPPALRLDSSMTVVSMIAGQDADGHAVSEGRAPRAAEQFREEGLVLQAHAQGERHAYHDGLSRIETVLEDRPHAFHEEQAHDQQQEGAHDGTGYREQHTHRLGQQGKYEQHATHDECDPSRGDSGEVDEGHAGRV